MAIKVYINEPIGGLTDQSARLWYGAQNGFTLIRGQRGTASIVFEIEAADSYEATVGSPIYIHEISSESPLYDVISFAGRIQKIERKWIGNEGDHDDTLTCVSLESCFDTIRIDPPTIYSGKTGGEIITAVYNTFCAGVPVTLGTIDLTIGGVLPDQVFRQSERVSDVFTAIATLMGNTVIWGVQMSDQTLYARVVSLVPAPFTLDAYLYETGDWIEDQTDYRNRQLVQGSFTAWSTSNEMFAGDNVSHSVRLRIPVDRVTSAMLTTSTQATATGVFGTLSPVASANPSPGDTFTITPPHSPPVVEEPYTFVTSLDNTLRNQILIGATAAQTCQNTVDAINANPLKAGITFSLPTWENDACNADQPLVGASAPTFTLRVKNPGAGGNGCILTSVHTLSPFVAGALVWQGGTLSPLVPPQTTGGTDGTNSALNVSVSGANALSTDVQYTPGSNLITFTAAIPGGTSLSIAYYGLGRDTLAVEDTAAVALRAAAEHGSGKYQQLITDTQNADARSIYIEALQALNNFKVIPISFQYSWFTPLISPGQLQTITVISPLGTPVLLDGTWLVQEIQATLIAGVETLPEPYGHFQYVVTVINTNMISTFVDFWQNLAIVTPAGAQTVNNISTQTASPSLNAPLPNNTPPAGTPPNTTGTLAPVPAGQQWIQEALGRYAQYKASNLAVDASVNTRVSAASRPFTSADIGLSVIVISGTGWTPGEYSIVGITGISADLSGSPAAVSTTGGVWALVSNDLWCTSYNISPSFTGSPVAIIFKNNTALTPFTAADVGPDNPGGGDYLLQKGNQIKFASAPTPGVDILTATYFPAGITLAPSGPTAATTAVFLDVLATDFPSPYIPHIPPGGDRHFFDVQVGSGQTVQEVEAPLTEVGTTDTGIIWSLISSDASTTDPAKIGYLTDSPNSSIGGAKKIYNAPAVLPSTLTPPLPDIVVLGVTSHADSSVQAFDTITLVAGGPPPPSGNFVAIAENSTTTTELMSSSDSVGWSLRSSGADPNGGLCIASGGGVIVALCIDGSGTANVSVTSSDHGLTWASHSLPAAPAAGWEFTYVIWIPSGPFFLAMTNGGGPLAFGGQAYTSPDGVTWTLQGTIPQTVGGHAFTSANGVALGAGLYVAVGGASDTSVATSPDLATWTYQTTPTNIGGSAVWWDVIFALSQFVSVGGIFDGSTPQVMTSSDGVTWTPQTSPLSATRYTGIAFGAGLYVAVSDDPAGITMTSPDGVSWTAHSVPDMAGANRVRFINGIFVACIQTPNVNFQTVLTSPDGLVWTTQTTAIQDQLLDVAFG